MSETFETLLREYRASFVEKAKAIASATTKADAAHWEPGSISTLATLIHKLAGSSGAYGFQDIHAIATATNKRLKTLSSLAPETPKDQLIDEIKTAVEQLVSVLRSNAL